MQTFFPHYDLRRSAKILDNKRLWRQIVECKQILKTLTGQSDAWKNHPAVLMWKGHEGFLQREYLHAMCEEAISRKLGSGGVASTQENGVSRIWEWSKTLELRPDSFDEPLWRGDGRLHRSHELSLLIKNPEHYKQYVFLRPTDDLTKVQYFWPTLCKDYGGEGDGYIKDNFVKKAVPKKDEYTFQVIVKIKRKK